MPLKHPNTPEDFYSGEMGPGLHVRRAGDEYLLELTPSCLFPNQYLHEISADGNPAGLLLPDYPEPDGYHVFVSDVPASQKSLTRQNTSSVPFGEAWTGNQPIIPGPSPVRQERFAGDTLVAPLAPEVEVIASGVDGFEAGTYGYLEGFADAGGRPTTAPHEIKVAVAQNQRIRFSRPASIPEGAVFWDIYLTRKGRGRATATRQARIRLSRLQNDTLTLSGPWKPGPKPPVKNRTKIGRPAPLVFGKTIFRHPAKYDLQPHDYRFAIALETAQGISLASIATNEVTVAQVETGIAFRVNVSRYLRPGIIGAIVYVSLNNVWYRVYDDRDVAVRVSAAERTRRWYGIPVHGYLPDNEPRGLGRRLRQEDPPSEDTTGIPDPQSEPEAPVAVGRALPTAGERFFAVSSTRGEEQSVLSPTTKVNLNGSQYPRVRPAPRVNLIRNAEFREKDAAGNVVGWTIVHGAFGLITPDSPEDGVTTIDTRQLHSSTDTRPLLRTHPINVDTSLVYTLAADITLLSRLAGDFVVFINQYDAQDVLVDAVTALRLNTPGVVRVRQTFGAEGVALNSACNHVRISIRPDLGTDSGYNLKALVSNVGLFALPVAPRKGEKAVAGSLEPSNPDPAPITPYPQNAEVRIESAPSVPGHEPETTAPLANVDFSTLQSFPPTGFTHTRDPATGTVSTLDNGTWLYSSVATSAQAAIVLDGTYPDSGSLAARQVTEIVRLPTRRASANALVIRTLDGTTMAFIRRHYDGSLYLRILSRTGAEQSARLAGALVPNGSIEDIELIVSGGGTKNGRAVALFGRDGEQRSVLAELGGIDWQNRRPRVARYGVGFEPSPNTTWENRTRLIRTTRTGDTLSESSGELPAGYVPTPDRPHLNYPAWAPKTVQAVGNERVPTTRNGNYYRAAVGGTTGPNEPAFPTAADATVKDNAGLAAVTRSTGYALGNSVLKSGGTSADAEWYECTTAGTTSATVPAYPTTAGATVQDGEDVAQVDTVEITAANSTAYTATIDGTSVSYTSDIDATEGEVALGLVAAINNNATLGPKVTAATTALAADAAANFTVKADVAGTPFTMTVGANLTSSTTTANRRGAVFTTRKTVTWQNAGSIYRDADPKGETINQLYFFLPPGTPRGRHVLLGADADQSPPVVVKPGQSYTFAVQAREVIFDDSGEPGNIHVVLTKPDGSETVASKLYGEAGITKATEQRDWGGEDRYATFTVPTGYTEMLVVAENMPNGEYVFQEILPTEGTHLTQANRDARRGYGRVVGPESFRITLDSETEAREHSISGVLPGWWAEFGAQQATADLPAGNALQNVRYRSGDDPDGTTWTAETADPALVERKRALQIAGELVGDGENTPSLPAPNVYLETKHPVGTLLRADRSEFPGAAIIGELPPQYDRPDYEVGTVGGHIYATPTTDSIPKLPGFSFTVATEDAYSELTAHSPNDPLVIEAPQSNNGAGVIYTVLLPELIEMEPVNIPTLVLYGHRRVIATYEVPYAEILSYEPM